MRYVFASTGQQVEVPLLPGLALRGDAWYSRAATPGGFNKTQVLAQEWTMAHPSGGENRAATAKGSPRCASLLGASAAAGGDAPGSPAASPAKPSSPRPSSRSPRRPGSRSAGRGPVDEDAAFTSEATAAFAPSSLAPMERPGVLRFAAYFTESTEWAFSGELGKPSDRGVQVRKCFVLFHLEDGTVEVLEERTSNSGVAGGRFFNRAPPGAAGMGWKTQPAPGVGAPSTAGPEGLEVGGELVFLGQTFYLVDADGFTRDWYARVFGKTQPPAVDYPVATPREYHAEHATGLGKAAGGVAYGKGGGFEVFRKSPEAGVRKQQMNKERQFFSHELRARVVAAVERRELDGQHLLDVEAPARRLHNLQQALGPPAPRVFRRRRLEGPDEDAAGLQELREEGHVAGPRARADVDAVEAHGPRRVDGEARRAVDDDAAARRLETRA